MTTNKNIQCYHCGKFFKNRSSLNFHIEKFHSRLRCLYCARSFKTIRYRDIHIEKFHPIVSTEPPALSQILPQHLLEKPIISSIQLFWITPQNSSPLQPIPKAITDIQFAI
jgi:hypothetical protein